jgi:hypothetical protein
MNEVLDRDALYYPYIHFRDVNWLKATLLSFPQVRRMVPPDFYLYDSPEVQKFRKLKGFRDEPLIREEETDQEVVRKAQERLMKKIQENEEEICQKYDLEATEKLISQNKIQINREKGINSFELHGGKMMIELNDYLQDRGLLWPTREIQGGYGTWYALNPILGEAIMSVIAINIAADNGLDIVTSSGYIHSALASLDEDAVFSNLLQRHPYRKPGEQTNKTTEMTDEITLMVLNTHFDLNRLSPEQIAELIKEGKDLRKFKQAIVPIAKRIPEIHNPKEREKRIKQASEEVIDAWQGYKKSLPKFAIDALMNVSKIKTPEIISGLTAMTASGLTFGVGIGLTIGFVTYSGYRVLADYKAQKDGPYQYLSKIEKAGASLITRPEKIRSGFQNSDRVREQGAVR